MQRIIASALLIGLVACSSMHGAGADDEVDANPGPTIDARKVDAAATPLPTIFTIVLENQDYADIVSTTAGDAPSMNAPYINSLIAAYGLATNYDDTGHPSTPNYLDLISGSNQYPGIIDVVPTQSPYFPADQPNLGTQLTAANITWKSYQESMGTPCKLVNDGEFAPRHDPFLYFKDQQMPAATCDANNVDFAAFPADLASNAYRYMWITPNLLDDGHDPSTQPATGLKQADTWLSTEVPKVLASAGYTTGGIIFITWDEAEGRHGDNADQIPMIVISPRLKTAPLRDATAYTHSSYLATIEDLLGLTRLATVTTTPSMIGMFNP